MTRAAGQRQRMSDHFSRVAGRYRELRTTDEEPIHFVREAMAGRSAIRAADIGCGDGRYDTLLFRDLPNLHLTCVDVNPEMLAQLSRYLGGLGIRDFETVAAAIEDLDLGRDSLDCVVSFNAVHHFDFPTFLGVAGRAIRADGQVFVYTRTPSQNAGSVWGRHFPDFCEKETRLYGLEQMEGWIATAGLKLIAAQTFRFARAAPLGHLLEQAQGRHYSTFSLYAEPEFDQACRTFASNIRSHFADPDKVEWYDENVMLQIGR